MPVLADQQELTYNSFVLTQDVVWKTYRKRWLIGKNGERESVKCMLAAWHDDDDDYDVLCLKINIVSYPALKERIW